MSQVTVGFDELEHNDLPLVCLACGAQHDVGFVPRTFVWRPLFAGGLLSMVLTKRVSVEVPLCPAHGGPRLFGYARFNWWGLQTVAIGPDTLTIGRVDPNFIDALYHWREQRATGAIGEPPPPPRPRMVQVGRGPGGGGTALKVLGIIGAVMAGAVALMVFGMVLLVGLFVRPRMMPPPPPAWPPPPVTAAPAPPPEAIVVGLLAAAPQAGGPAALPWAPLVLGARKSTFHLLEDADLDRALADLRSRNPNTVAEAAQTLAGAAPDPPRRKETAEALLLAMANPFPSARDAAAEALAVWGTAEETPALARMAAEDDPNARAAAIIALAGLKNDRAAAAIAGRLSDFFDREKARAALEGMGPAAENAVVPLVNKGDPQTRAEACGVLKTIGTKASLPELEKAARDPDRNVARVAAEAVKGIQDRRKLDEKHP